MCLQVASNLPLGKLIAGLTLLSDRRIFAQVFIPCFDRSVQFDRQGLALAVNCLACLDPHPAFGNAIFLYIRAHAVLELDANAALQLLAVEKCAARVYGQVIGWCVLCSFFSHGAPLVALEMRNKRLTLALFLSPL